MKINSNTLKLEKESHEKLEEIIKKIASENKIENVKSVQIKLSKENGIVRFAVIDDWADYDEKGEEIRYTQETEEDSKEGESEYGPYKFRITYQIVTPESAEEGDFEDQGWHDQDGYAEDMNDLINQLDQVGFAQDNRPDILDELSFDTVDPEANSDYYGAGEEKYYTVFIEREDGENFEQKEADEIKQRLNVR